MCFLPCQAECTVCVYYFNVFLGVAGSGVSERADDVQSVSGFCVNVVCMLFECHPSVECYSKDFGAMCDWGGVCCLVLLVVVFCFLACEV